MKCPVCGEVIQVSQDCWFTLDDELGTYRSDYEIRVYCVNDHEIEDDEIVDWAAQQIDEWEERTRVKTPQRLQDMDILGDIDPDVDNP